MAEGKVEIKQVRDGGFITRVRGQAHKQVKKLNL
jgi:hypothetical protein